MQDNRKVAKAGLLMAGAAALCRLVSLGKEVFVAFVFGAGVVTDAYALAMLIPAMGMALFVSAVRRAFLVNYPKLLQQGKAAADDFVSQFLTSLMAASVCVAGIASITLRPLWTHLIVGDNAAVISTSQGLVVLASWTIVPIAAIAGLTAVLNAQKRFSLPQLTAAIPTISVIIAVAIAYRMADLQSVGAYALLGGLFAGCIVQAGVLAAMSRRGGNSLRWRFDPGSQACTVLWRFALPLIVLDVLTQANVYVDRTMASLLETGKVAVLGWSAAMKDFLTGTLIASLLLVLLPHFSQQAARGAKEELRRSVALVLRYAAITLFPISALVCVCCPPLFRYVEIGQLDAVAARSLAYCLAAYSLGFFADLASTSLYQALMALGRLRTLLLLAILASVLPNLLFNVALIGPLKEVGLALSTSLVGYCTLLANYLVLRRCLGAHEELKTVGAVVTALLASGAMALAGFAVLASVRSLWPAAPWGDLAGAAAAALVGVALYAFLLLVFPGDEDARRAARLVRDKLLSATRTVYS